MKSYGVHTALETAADISKDIFVNAIDNIDLILMDYKSANKEKLLQYTGGNYKQIKGNAEAACRLGKEIIARIPVIPSFNFDNGSMAEIFQSLSEIGITKADLLPYHVMGKKKYSSLGIEYPFIGYEKSLEKEDLLIYKELGEDYKIHTTISGK